MFATVSRLATDTEPPTITMTNANASQTHTNRSSQPSADGAIVIRGAREHNLKHVDLVLPRNRLIVVTGISGSGK